MTSISKEILSIIETETYTYRPTVKSLAIGLRVSQRTIERGLEELRIEGHPICSQRSGKNKGLYIAKDKVDLFVWVSQMELKIKKMKSTVERVKVNLEIKQNRIEFFNVA